jgi:hypothetical protein
MFEIETQNHIFARLKKDEYEANSNGGYKNSIS